VLHPVCDTIDALVVGGARRLRCSVCHADLGDARANPKLAGAVRDRPLAEINPHNRRCLPEYVVREYCCPGCATAFAADVAHVDEPMLDEVALA
jgi:acetone carboxylase gamma subunit